MSVSRSRNRSPSSRTREHPWLPLVRQTVQQIVERFDPERVILFGSLAYGEPHSDSDVDLLVVMPTRNAVSMACRIRLAVEHPYPLDLLVRSPSNIQTRLANGDCFLAEILSKGVVLHEKARS